MRWGRKETPLRQEGKERGTIPGAMNKYQKARAALAFLHAIEAREVASIFWRLEACVGFICPASLFFSLIVMSKTSQIHHPVLVLPSWAAVKLKTN